MEGGRGNQSAPPLMAWLGGMPYMVMLSLAASPQDLSLKVRGTCLLVPRAALSPLHSVIQLNDRLVAGLALVQCERDAQPARAEKLLY